VFCLLGGLLRGCNACKAEHEDTNQDGQKALLHWVSSGFGEKLSHRKAETTKDAKGTPIRQLLLSIWFSLNDFVPPWQLLFDRFPQRTLE